MTAPLGATDILLRLGAAVIAGGIIGYERESHGRAAGLRTTLLVCVAAAVAMLLSDYLYGEHLSTATGWRPDPARLAQGILSGMGFLGAGAIIREGNAVRGVTTAAVLWFVSILGLAFGSGNFLLGGLGWVVAMATLFVLPTAERRIRNDWYGVVTVTLAAARPADADDAELRRRIAQTGATVKKVDVDHDVAAGAVTFRCEIKYKSGDLFDLSARVRTAVLDLPGVVRLRWS